MTRNLTTDAPTLRLITLRRIVARRPPPLVFGTRTPVDAIMFALRRSQAVFAAIIDDTDDTGILRGTLCIADLADHDGQTLAERAMVTTAPMLRPEDDIDEALLEMMGHAADRVLVVDSRRTLLGVLTERDLMPAPRAA